MIRANFIAGAASVVLALALGGCASGPSQDELHEVHSYVAETFRFHDSIDLLEGTSGGPERAWEEAKSYCRLYHENGEILNTSAEDIWAEIRKQRFWSNFGIDASKPQSLWRQCLYEGANQFKIRMGENPADLWEQ